MMRTFPAAAGVAAILLLGTVPVSFAAMPTARHPAGNAMMAPAEGIGNDPTVRSLIQSYYAAHAQEGASCGPVTMGSVLSAPTIARAHGDVTLHVSYTFETVAPRQTGVDCSGLASRDFVLTRGSTGWRIQSMSGDLAV